MKQVIGIDIGEINTKVAVIEVGAKPCIRNCFYFKTPYTGAKTGKKIDHSQVAQEVTKVIAVDKLKNSRIGINIPTAAPIVMTLALPKMGKRDLIAAALAEAKRKMIPAPGPNSMFETIVLGEVTENNIPRHEVLVVREEKDAVNFSMQMFKQTGVIPYVVTPTAVSYGTLLVKRNEYKNKETAFIDIGHSAMRISVFRGSSVIFNRTISFGIKNIVDSIIKGLDLKPDKAQEIILEHGIPDVEFDPKKRVELAEMIMKQKYEASSSGDGNQVNKLELRMLLDPALERIINEIRRTFIYFKDRYEARKIEGIFFIGGGAMVPGLIEMVGKRISPAPEKINCAELLGIGFQGDDLSSVGAMYAGAVSIANSTTLKVSDVINFLPFELKRRDQIAIHWAIFNAVCIFVSALFFILWLNSWITAGPQRKEVKRLDFELSRLSDVFQKQQNLNEQIATIKAKEKLVEDKITQRKEFRYLMADLSEIKPEAIVFTSVVVSSDDGASSAPKKAKRSARKRKSKAKKPTTVKVEDSEVSIDIAAKIYAGYEESIEIIKNFEKRLKELKYLKKVELTLPEVGEMVPEITIDDISLSSKEWKDFSVKFSM